MLTYDTKLSMVIKKIIRSRIEDIKEEISAGMLKSHEDYKSKTGQLQGLRLALDIVDEAITDIEKG